MAKRAIVDDGEFGAPPTPAAESMTTEEKCVQLMQLRRQKMVALKIRAKIDNQMGAATASAMGYRNDMTEADRRALRKEADTLFQSILKKKPIEEKWHHVLPVIGPLAALVAGPPREHFQKYLARTERAMAEIAESMPIARWAELPGQRGFGLLSLADIIGECGALSNYPGPRSVFKRLGLAPWEGRMPSTWRTGGGNDIAKEDKRKLSAEEWSVIGYSPRRRSMMFNIGQSLIKQNVLDPEARRADPEASRVDGPWRQFYLDVKVSAAAKHPNWSPMHVARHAELLMVKALVKELWRKWQEMMVGCDARLGSAPAADAGDRMTA